MILLSGDPGRGRRADSGPATSPAVPRLKWGHSSFRCNKRGRSGGWRPRLPRVDPLCSLKVARASKISADGNFRRSLVGSLRALTSAEMAALRCNAAARSGFLLAALHSVAERVNPRKARPPTPHGPRVLASAGRPHLPLLGEECTTPGLSKNQNTESCDLFHPRGHTAMARQRERSCGSWRRRRAVRSSGKRGQTASGGTPVHGGLSLRPNGARRGKIA